MLLLLWSRIWLFCGERGQTCLLSGNCCCLNWFQNRLQPLGVRAENTVFSAYANKSNVLMNEEVRIGSFRFSSLKGPFKCIRICVIGSAWSGGLGVGGHDDLASFSCFSWVWMPSVFNHLPQHGSSEACWVSVSALTSCRKEFGNFPLTLPTTREWKTREITPDCNDMIINLWVQKAHLSVFYWCNFL